KGPVKRIVNELGKRSIVMLIPEYNTSKICNICESDLKDVNVIERPIKTKIDNEKMENTMVVINKKKQFNKMMNMYHECGDIETSNCMKKVVETIMGEIENKKTYYKPSYRLRLCVDQHMKHENVNGCKLWERNMNASLNMINKFKMMVQKNKGGTINKSKLFPDTTVQKTEQTPSNEIKDEIMDEQI